MESYFNDQSGGREFRKREGDWSERVVWRLKLDPELRPSFFSSAFGSAVTFSDTASLLPHPQLGIYTEILPTSIVYFLTISDYLCLLFSLLVFLSAAFKLPTVLLFKEQWQDWRLIVIVEVTLPGQGRGHSGVQKMGALEPQL